MPAKLPEPHMQLNARVPAALLRQAQAAARRADLMMSQWIRQAIREKLDRDQQA